MDRFQEMTVFAVVADERSFAAAARLLKLSATAVTRAVVTLEERIGAQLLARTRRGVHLTEIGERYLEDCRQILAELAKLKESAVATPVLPHGQLVVTAPVQFGEMVLASLLIEYMDAWPSVSIRALLVDRVASMIDEGIDVAIRIGAAPDAALHSVPVGSVRRVVCGAPELLERFGVPTHPEQLADYPLVAPTSGAQDSDWQFAHAGTLVGGAVKQRFNVNSSHAAILGATRGRGLIRLLSYQVAPQLASGSLVVVLADYEPAPLTVEVVCLSARQGLPRIRSFVDFCVTKLRFHPSLQS